MDAINAAIAAGEAEPLPATSFKIFTGILKAQRADDGMMRLSGTASSTVTDMHGDNMLRSALEDMLRAANNNMTIFLNHSYNVPEDVAGSSKGAQLVQRSSDVWDLDIDVDVNAKNPRAVEAFNAIDSGVKLGLSIGAMIPEGGAVRNKETGAYTIAHVDLLETSIVGIPANPRSWVQSAVKALMKSTDQSEERQVVREIKVENLVLPEELKEAPAAEPDVCGERDASGSTACTAEPGHEGDHSWSDAVDVDIDVTDAQPTTDTDDDSDVVDGGSQGASDSEPEPEPASEDVVLDADPEPVDVSPVVTSLSSALQLLESTATDLISTRRALREAEEARDAAIRERDEVSDLANSVITETSRIIENMADTPIGRRAVMRQAANELGVVERLYGPAITKLMRGKNND
jgi:HK97 family phage prohead protease